MAHALSGYNFSARMLSRKDAQSTFFSLILNVPGWWATYKNALINLRRQSTRVPKLAQALTKIAREALPLAIDMVKNEKNSILVDMMRCAAPPQEEPSVWYDLLYKMPKTKQTLDFLQNHWSIHTELMKAWAIAVPPSITPLLTTSWAKFGEFLNLDLPFDWVEIATEALVFRAKELGFPPPDQERVHYLEQKYHQNIQKLLEQLSQNPQRSLIVTALFDTLVTNGYQKKMALLLILLDSPMGNDENTAKGLLRIVQLAPDEKALFLANYGPRYLPNKQFTVVLLDLFTELASSDLQKEKMRVLFSWLDSPHLSPWLNPPQKGGENLATVLIRASLNTNQIGEFFQRYGQKYIPLYPQSSILLSLLDSYASSRGRLRLSLLNTWFKCNLSEETLTRILGNTHLTSGEKVSFLQHYGKHYLSLYPHWGLLKDYAQEFLNYLRTTNITIFKGDPTPEKPSSTEEFLSFLSTSSLPHVQLTLIYHWYNVAQFVGQPSLLRKEKEGEPIAQSIKYLLVNTLEVQSPMRTGLIRELAGACIANENEVKRMIDRIHSILVLPDRVQLLHNIAESVRDGIYQKKYAKTLYVSCIQSALGFKQAEQESFVNNFLNTLLQNVDERTLKWLDKEATHWPANISTSWRRYRSQRSSSSTTGKSLLQRIKPFLDT